jgi:hypothetical protein
LSGKSGQGQLSCMGWRIPVGNALGSPNGEYQRISQFIFY